MPKKFIPSLCERSIVQGYSSAESDLEPTEDQLPSLNHRSRGRDKQCVRYPRPHSHLFRNRFGGRTRGGRHARRQDNSLYLTTLYQIDEEDYIDDYKNVVPEHNTPFKRLLTSDMEQKLWESFDSLSEEDQETVLTKKLRAKQCGKCPEHKLRVEQLEHLDPHLRKILLHTKRIPKEFISSLEEDLREFFGDDEAGVMVFVQLTSFQRMLVHGICQHTGLTSQRFEINGESYLLVILDKEKAFDPPPQMLHSILK